MTQIMVEYNKIDNSRKFFKKLLKVKKSQRSKKSAKTINLKELSILTFITMLIFIKIYFRYIKLITVSFWLLLKTLKN